MLMTFFALSPTANAARARLDYSPYLAQVKQRSLALAMRAIVLVIVKDLTVDSPQQELPAVIGAAASPLLLPSVQLPTVTMGSLAVKN